MCSSYSSTMLFLFSLTIMIMLFPLSITCFDISKILSQYPEYSTYSNYLTQTQLATEINGRQTITVLAVDNGGMAPISGKPMDVIKNVLSVHVIFDYYDVPKLQHLGNQNVIVTTLFQSSGLAKGMNGFLNISSLSTGAVTFTSPSGTDGTGANLVKSVAADPYNIAVLQISTVIMPPSLIASSNAHTLAPAPVPVLSPIPAVPVLVVSPVPVVAPSPMATPVPVVSPVSVVSPAPMAFPVPVKSPVPVVSPVPAAAPVAAPVQIISPVAAPVPVLSPTTNPDEAAGDGSNSGATKSDVNNSLALFLTLSSIYVLLSWSIYNTES